MRELPIESGADSARSHQIHSCIVGRSALIDGGKKHIDLTPRCAWVKRSCAFSRSWRRLRRNRMWGEAHVLDGRLSCNWRITLTLECWKTNFLFKTEWFGLAEWYGREGRNYSISNSFIWQRQVPQDAMPYGRPLSLSAQPKPALAASFGFVRKKSGCVRRAACPEQGAALHNSFQPHPRKTLRTPYPCIHPIPTSHPTKHPPHQGTVCRLDLLHVRLLGDTKQFIEVLHLDRLRLRLEGRLRLRGHLAPSRAARVHQRRRGASGR